MTSQLSNVVELLSTTDNLASLATYTSNRVLMQEYASIIISVYADQDLVVLVQFSNDSVNWDISVSKNFPASTAGSETLVISGKWCRISVTNLGLSATTALRIYTYASVDNTALNALIQKVGNVSPEISVDNLPTATYGDVMVSKSSAVRSYMMSTGTGGVARNQSWVLPYADIVTNATNLSPLLTVAGGLVSLTNVIPGEEVYLSTGGYRCKAGRGIMAQYAAMFVQGLKNVGGPGAATEYIGCGNGDVSTMAINDFVGFGYGDPSLPSDELGSFGVVYIARGVRTFYQRSSWNLDRADGTGVLPLINWATVNTFRVQFQYCGDATLYILNPNTGLFVAVHQIRTAGSLIESNVGSPTLGLLMYLTFEAGSVPATIEDTVSVASYTLFEEPELHQGGAYEHGSISTTVAGITAETAILSIRCTQTYYGAANLEALVADRLSVASTTGTKPCVVRLYRNATLAGPVWTYPYANYIPVETDTTGTLGAPGAKTFCLHSLCIAADNDVQIDFGDTHNRVLLYPGDTLTVTASSAVATDITAGLSFQRE